MVQEGAGDMSDVHIQTPIGAIANGAECTHHKCQRIFNKERSAIIAAARAARAAVTTAPAARAADDVAAAADDVTAVTDTAATVATADAAAVCVDWDLWRKSRQNIQVERCTLPQSTSVLVYSFCPPLGVPLHTHAPVLGCTPPQSTTLLVYSVCPPLGVQLHTHTHTCTGGLLRYTSERRTVEGYISVQVCVCVCGVVPGRGRGII